MSKIDLRLKRKARIRRKIAGTGERPRLSVYKIPRRVLFLDSVDDVPMTPSMKVRKRELAAMLAAMPEEAER